MSVRFLKEFSFKINLCKRKNLVQTWIWIEVSESCSLRCQQMSWQCNGPLCCKGFTMATRCLSHRGMCQVDPWLHSPSSSAPWRPRCSKPLHCFGKWLITALMKYESSWNVTEMTRACQYRPAGSNVLNTDIWKDTKHRLLLPPEIVSVGFYVTLFN